MNLKFKLDISATTCHGPLGLGAVYSWFDGNPLPEVLDGDQMNKSIQSKQNGIISSQSLSPHFPDKSNRVNSTRTGGMQNNGQGKDSMWDGDGIAYEME